MSGCVDDDLGGLLKAAHHQSLEVRGRLRRRFVMRAARCELHFRHAGTSFPTHSSGLGASDRGGTWSAWVAGRSRHHTQTGPDARRRARAFLYW